LTTACLTTTRQASTGQQLSELLPRLSADKAVDVVWTTHSARSAAVLHASHPELWRRLIHLLTPYELQRLLDAASPAPARLLAELRASPPPARRQLRTSGMAHPAAVQDDATTRPR